MILHRVVPALLVTALATRPAAAQEPPRRPLFALPTLRAGLGAHVPLNDPAASDTGFALDVLAGAVLLRGDGAGLMFLPELGYALDGARRGGHFFTAGLTVMYGTLGWGAGLSSRAVLGDADDRFGYGARNSVALHLLATSLMLELGHQWTRVGDEDRHDLRITVSVSPIPLVVAFLGMVGMARAASSVGRTLDTATTHPGDLLLPPSARPRR